MLLVKPQNVITSAHNFTATKGKCMLHKKFKRSYVNVVVKNSVQNIFKNIFPHGFQSFWK